MLAKPRCLILILVVCLHRKRMLMTCQISVSPKETLGNIKFTESDVKLLQNLNSSKLPGPDNMHPRILKECAQELAVILYMLFR